MTVLFRTLRAASFVAACLLAGAAAAATGTDSAGNAVATGGLSSGELIGASLRMIAGLAVVLGLLGVAAWASRRFRISSRLRGGAIEVTSGISLGAREKVVLLRVGREQVLVGVSPAGMRTLHVLKDPAAPDFASQLESQA